MTTKAMARAATSAARREKQKRGIVLLIVISLLAMFVLLGVTYALVARNYQTASRDNVRRDEVGDPPATEMDLVLGQILYDTAARTSLKYHSLLADLYGGDSVRGVAAGVPEFFAPDPSNLNNRIQQVIVMTAVPSGGFSANPNYYAGRVLTFLGGEPSGLSARIMAYVPSATAPQFFLEAFERGTAQQTLPSLWNAQNWPPIKSVEFIINGAPFNGSGAGYDPNTYTLGATYEAPDGSGGYLSANAIALLPHFSGYDRGGRLSAAFDMGGLDESWDAPDFQNMFLAMVPASSAESSLPSIRPPVIPSFHRPELIAYWLDRAQWRSDLNQINFASPQVRDYLRTFILRPMPWDHPNFTGSNPTQYLEQNPPVGQQPRLRSMSDPIGALTNLIQLHGTWDVDNDGDGRPDSIWIDPGLPVVTTPEGRRYKRLAAILIKDLDGRVNVNAHGNTLQVPAVSPGVGVGLPQYRADQALPSPFGLNVTNTLLPRGMGFGPAEVDFLNVLTLGGAATNNHYAAYDALLRGRYDSPAEQGANRLIKGAGAFGTVDVLSAIKHYGLPRDYTAAAPVGGSGNWYASPPDVWGRAAVTLDYGGQPLYIYSGDAREMEDMPYEISLSGAYNNLDSPYTQYELERLLRYHDADAAQLPDRLLKAAADYLAPGYPFYTANGSEPPGTVFNVGSQRRRELLTTHSSYLPVPATPIPPEMRRAAGMQRIGYATILDLYRAKLANVGLLTEPQLSQVMQQIVPWEFFKGQKFDINRWLGNGRDDDNDGAVDGPSESAAGEGAWPPIAVQSYSGNGSVNSVLARQLYARHLFCLAMLLVPDTFQPPPTYPPDSNVTAVTQSRRLMVRRIAQWAINCVDFRDPDGIMTPFEFDYNPWDGWHLDGDLRTDGVNAQELNLPALPQPFDRGVVWGMEYPELLITETLAFHDRRVKDTQHDSSGHDRDDTPQNDPTVDQFGVPEGSLFVELYCPRPKVWNGAGQTTNQKPHLPREFYNVNATTGAAELRMGDLSPAVGGGARWPVWRLALGELNGNDPNHPATLLQSAPESTSFEPEDMTLLPGSTPARVNVNRYAYFGNASTIPLTELQRSFYNVSTNPLLSPGSYAVIGPRQITYVGSQDPATAVPAATAGSLWGGYSPQRIEFTAGGVGMTITDTNGTPTVPVGNILPPITVISELRSPNDSSVPPTPLTAAVPWTKPWTVGLNITQPLPSGNFYPEPLPASLPAGVPNYVYDDPEAPVGSFPNDPVESPTPPQNALRPIAQQGMTNTGTYLDCGSIFLQRLANPLLPYNPVPGDPYHVNTLEVNPYLTIDWASTDVTVFSGEENTARQVTVMAMMEWLDTDDQDPGTNAPSTRFRSRQRGYLQTAQATCNPWPPLTINGMDTANGAAAGAYFKVDLSNNQNNTYEEQDDRHTLGYLNATVDYPPGPPYAGEPPVTRAFPWLAWHNRPFMNAMELLLVPSSSPARVYGEVTPGFPIVAGPGQFSPYRDTAVAQDDEALRRPFAHLLNLFHSDNSATAAFNSPLLFRLLEFVEAPSPYLGAEKWYNPQQFTAVPNTYLPPFNKLSRFRDPGRININTIFDKETWDAAMAKFPQMSSDSSAAVDMADKVFLSRQGYGTVRGDVFTMSTPAPAAAPTIFANPFRSSDSADLMPDVPLLNGVNMRKTNPVEATLLRPDPDPAKRRKPLLSLDVDAGQGTEPFRDARRNAYFRYQPLQKIGNVFSTHSNCFAVWITIGYFEVEDNTVGAGGVDAAHPDGLMLSQEVGADSGEVKRHRAFFIIDRSVPVGFIPGSRLNTDDCVLLRRMIE